jgi:hypothetical protein
VKDRRHLLRPAALAVLGTLGLAAALVTRPGDSSPAFDAFALFLGALGVVVLVKALSRSFNPPTQSQLQAALRRPRTKQPRVPELERLERELDMAMESAYDSYYRLRPTLREIAAGRLARRALELDQPGRRAERVLGADLWAFVRPDLERPSNHHAEGATLAQIEGAIEALERLGA